MDTTPYHFNVGSLECTVLSDGLANYKATSFFVNAPEDELKAALARHDIRKPHIPTALNCLLVRTEDHAHTVLIDTGLGRGKGTGRLRAALQAAGVAPEAVDTVILSHWHGDHTNGVMDARGCPAFPNAHYILTATEWEFWCSQDSAVHARTAIQAQVRCIVAGTEVYPGIGTMAAPGHTPGHLAVELSSAGERLLYPGDAVAHPIHLEHPDWNIVSDRDREQAVRTRRQLLDEASAEHVPMLVYHFPFPGLYRVEAHGSACSAIPIGAVGGGRTVSGRGRPARPAG